MIAGKDLESRPRPDHVAAAEVRNAAVSGRWVEGRFMQGNHRVWAAQADGLRHVEGILYTTDEWLQLISQF